MTAEFGLRVFSVVAFLSEGVAGEPGSVQHPHAKHTVLKLQLKIPDPSVHIPSPSISFLFLLPNCSSISVWVCVCLDCCNVAGGHSLLEHIS